MKAWAPDVTVAEVTYEALPQLALQVTPPSPPPPPRQIFIVLRTGVRPGWVQLASIASSFLTATIGPAEEFLQARQDQLYDEDPAVKQYTDMGLGDKLPLLGIRV